MSEFTAFVGPTYTSLSTNVGCEKTVNWYVERTESEGAKVRRALYPTPGIRELYNLPETPIRGLFEQNGRAFAVAGEGFYELYTDGSYVLRGSMTQGLTHLGPATLASNGPAGHQVFITSFGLGYVFDLASSGFSFELTGCHFCGFVDGYFLALDTGTATLRLSALEDGTTWGGGDVSQRNTAGDRWASMLIAHRDVWLFGSQRTDVWRNTGNADFPFEPIDGAFIEQGIAAVYSAAVLDNTPVWLAANENGPAVVLRAEGYSPRRISTHAVEHAIQSYAIITDAVAWTYQHEGHSFYVLNFPTAGATWVYDAATELWHERGAWNVASAMYEAIRWNCHSFAFGRHLVGDRLSNHVFVLDHASSFEGNGALVRRLRRSPYIQTGAKRVTHHSVQVDFEVGLGNATDAIGGDNPQAMLRWSNNQAKTWSSEHWAAMGRIGEYDTRVVWNRLGQAVNRVYEVVVSDPVPHRVAGAWIDVSVND